MTICNDYQLMHCILQGLLRRVTTFGAGLLIGTALIIIIPEGVEALYSEGTHYARF